MSPNIESENNKQKKEEKKSKNANWVQLYQKKKKIFVCSEKPK